MKNFEEMKLDERQHVVEIVSNWLHDYVHEIVIDVMGRIDEILADDFAVELLEELYERETAEREDFEHSIELLMRSYDQFAKYNVHNHPLTHSNSYRDILYDRYIRDRYIRDIHI